MATYSAIHKWATKADRQSVQMWLPKRIVRALDELATARSVTDPITGKERKISRADVVTILYDEPAALGFEYSDAVRDYADSVRENSDALADENAAYISALEDARKREEDAEGRIESQATEIRILTEQLDTAQNALAIREEAESEGVSIDDMKDAIANLPESALTPISLALGNRANKLQGGARITTAKPVPIPLQAVPVLDDQRIAEERQTA